MTRENFNNYGFTAGMTCIYKGKEYPIVMIDYEEGLIGYNPQCEGGSEDDVSWCRCESVEVLPTKPKFILTPTP